MISDGFRLENQYGQAPTAPIFCYTRAPALAAGAWLFYSGSLLWVETRRKAQRRGGEVPAQRRDTVLMASAAAGR